MRSLLLQILCITEVILCAADSPPLSEDMLKKLSAAGEQFTYEEIKQTVLDVKQVKEVMERKEEKHKHLMEALKHSSDKKKGAMQLARETEQKLKEAELQCQNVTTSSFEECRPCLEDSCKAFYASTCRRGYASFSFKVGEFFKQVSAQVEATEEENSDKTPSAVDQEDQTDLDLLQAEASFIQLLSNTSLLYNHSIILTNRMQHAFGHSFLQTFTSETEPSLLSTSQARSRAGFVRGLDHIFHSAYEFGKEILEDFSSTVADVFGEIQEAGEDFQHSNRDAEALSGFGHPPGGYLCRRLRRGVSACWQLHDLCDTCRDYLLRECPRVQQLYSEVDEMNTLLNASSQQYDDRLRLVHRHTADTQRWLSNIQDKYGWISQLYNTMRPQNNFNVITVSLQHQVKNGNPKACRTIVVSMLDSGPITVLISPDLMVDDPAFMKHVVQEALIRYKQQMRGVK